MKRDPNGPIPGFEGEFTGTVGHEKAVHKTHFEVPPLHLKKARFDTGYEWVKDGVGKWRLIKKYNTPKEDAKSVATAGGE
jgi:hypothetical protein